ncbi:NADPH:quinone oxidoreductase family protein [Rhodococcus sp. NCIMB 12038]|uniref:NADPH:quinone oxidoreductase family protein n=1 Tax=Rhodococcus sp. NCIMB 12038 TaxID=933800 RepID=UPI000B3C2EFF|nr:NADPH:quinone oxidoreductase family protein [Rhodococcus sp. NCIMB 12038]OUS88645.1 NADPH:quinone oxidoreductase [Rhodococcus sp. NCIMB 12038]
MRAVLCTSHGSPESLEIEDVPRPCLGDKDIRIDVRAASVNFPDTLIVEGKYQVQPELPFTPGFEVAGVVSEVGSGVTEYEIGQKVMALLGAGYGGFAEEAVTDQHTAELIPEGMDYTTATAFYSCYGTSFHALVQRGQLRAGETLLVLGAAGGIGLASIEIGKALGAHVIAAAGSPEKLAMAKAHGADELIDYRKQDLRGAIRNATRGKGVDVCVDAVGGDAFHAASREMAQGGRLLVVGFASGSIPSVAVNLLLLKGYSVVGVYWNTFVQSNTEEKARNSRELARLFAAGKLQPLVSNTFPMQAVAEALKAIHTREVIGKLVLTVP